MGSVFYFHQEYIVHVDPVSQLGLSSDSVLGYSIGEIKRSNASETPELLPCGYLVGENTTILVTVKGKWVLAEGWWRRLPLIPALRRQRWAEPGISQFKGSLVHRASSRIGRATQRNLVSKKKNPKPKNKKKF
jgi:hypothetical protein